MRKIKELLQETFSRWSAHEAPRLAAALTFYAILSLSPLLVLAVMIAGFVFGQEAARQQIMEQAQGLIGAEGASTVGTAMQSARQPRAASIAGLLSLAVLLFSASGVFVELRSALNKVWDVAPEKSTGMWEWIKDRFFSAGLVLALGFLLLVLLLVSTALAALTGVIQRYIPLPTPVMYLISIAISLGGVTFIFAAIFKYVPEIDVQWRRLLPGALFTAVLFEIGRFAIGLYLGTAAVGSAYGAAGSLVVFLVWLFYASLIFYFGAEFTRVWAERKGWRPERAAERERAVALQPTEKPGRTREGAPSPAVARGAAPERLEPAPEAGRSGLALAAGALAAMAMLFYRKR